MAKILVVDDIEQNRYMQKVLLSAHGHEVVAATNGIEALERARDLDFDLIVTDILMPDMDGFELCRRWNADERLCRVPLIFYTATYTDSQDEAFALSLGAARFVRKPGEPDAVLKVIEEVLADRSNASTATQTPHVADNGDYLRQYNAALIRKLEAKVAQLETARSDLADKLAALEESQRRRAELERDLLHAQRLDAVGQVASGVAHDFNNMLTAIRGYTSLCMRRLEPESAAHADLTAVQGATDRAAELTAQLLAFGRQQLLNPRVHDANAIVQEFAGLLQRALGDGIQLAISLSSESVRVRVDRGQAEQVLMNLALNASDAMGGHGNISITTSRVEHGGEPYVRIAVADSGNGIDAETRARIFEPFFTTKDKGKGTGLGLSTVYGIVQQSGGHIEFTSTVGHGTEFSVLLPRTDACEGPVESIVPCASASEHAGAVVLVVEDDDAVRDVAARALRASALVVHEAATPAEALDIARAQPRIDVLFTDYLMFGGSGIELATDLLKSQPETRVLLTSGYAMDVGSDKGEFAGKVEFIAKPYSPEQLVNKLRMVLEH